MKYSGTILFSIFEIGPNYCVSIICCRRYLVRGEYAWVCLHGRYTHASSTDLVVLTYIYVTKVPVSMFLKGVPSVGNDRNGIFNPKMDFSPNRTNKFSEAVKGD